MQRRKFIVLIGGLQLVTTRAPALADSSGPQLASYYDRHMAMLGGVAVAAGDTAAIALHADGNLLQWDAGVGPRRLRVP